MTGNPEAQLLIPRQIEENIQKCASLKLTHFLRIKPSCGNSYMTAYVYRADDIVSDYCICTRLEQCRFP